MIPKLFEAQEAALPTRTYGLDAMAGRIRGKIDGEDALRQAAEKILSSERYAHLIYNYDYGVEKDKYIGADFAYVEASLGRDIEEALLADERIERIEDFEITQAGTDRAVATFRIIADTGTLDWEMEVGW